MLTIWVSARGRGISDKDATKASEALCYAVLIKYFYLGRYYMKLIYLKMHHPDVKHARQEQNLQIPHSLRQVASDSRTTPMPPLPTTHHAAPSNTGPDKHGDDYRNTSHQKYKQRAAYAPAPSINLLALRVRPRNPLRDGIALDGRRPGAQCREVSRLPLDKPRRRVGDAY